MSFTAIAVAALMGQSAFSLAISEPKPDSVDAAYTELAAGQYDDAVNKLEARYQVDRTDPATLINLGAAYAATGQSDRALASYQAAIDSGERYELQLADGTWADSRVIARTAMRNLLSANMRASR